MFASERRFTLALTASVMAHTGLLAVLLSGAAGLPPGHAAPEGTAFITAFLVPAPLPGNDGLAGPGAAGRHQVTKVRGIATAIAPRQADSEKASLVDQRDEAINRTGPLIVARPDQDLSTIVAPAAAHRRTDPERALPVAEGAGRSERMDASPQATPRSQEQGAEASEDALPGSGKGYPAGDDSDSALLPRQGRGASSAGRGGGFSGAQSRGTAEPGRWDGGASRTGDADAAPRYGDNVRPTYPQLARIRGYQGIVVLRVEVLTDGKVGRIEVGRSAGHEILDRAAVTAVRTWRFEPARRGGRSMAMVVDVPVRFVLRDEVR